MPLDGVPPLGMARLALIDMRDASASPETQILATAPRLAPDQPAAGSVVVEHMEPPLLPGYRPDAARASAVPSRLSPSLPALPDLTGAVRLRADILPTPSSGATVPAAFSPQPESAPTLPEPALTNQGLLLRSQPTTGSRQTASLNGVPVQSDGSHQPQPEAGEIAPRPMDVGRFSQQAESALVWLPRRPARTLPDLVDLDPGMPATTGLDEGVQIEGRDGGPTSTDLERALTQSDGPLRGAGAENPASAAPPGLATPGAWSALAQLLTGETWKSERERRQFPDSDPKAGRGQRGAPPSSRRYLSRPSDEGGIDPDPRARNVRIVRRSGLTRSITRIFEAEDVDIPDDYRRTLIRLLTRQAALDADVIGLPPRVIGSLLWIASDLSEWLALSRLWMEWAEQMGVWVRMLRGLGYTFGSESPAISEQELDQDAMLGEAVSAAWIIFLAGCRDASMAYEWLGASYGPLAQVASQLWREDAAHARFGVRLLQKLSASPSGRDAVRDQAHYWLSLALDTLSQDTPEVTLDCIRWGLRRRFDDDLRADFLADVHDLLQEAGIDVNDDH